ncbi:MAG: hypothetical protein P8Y58_13365, partial [Novosphingobium sp.]
MKLGFDFHKKGDFPKKGIHVQQCRGSARMGPAQCDRQVDGHGGGAHTALAADNADHLPGARLFAGGVCGPFLKPLQGQMDLLRLDRWREKFLDADAHGPQQHLRVGIGRDQKDVAGGFGGQASLDFLPRGLRVDVDFSHHQVRPFP